MSYKLIMLPNPILISDEEIKEGDWFYCTRGDIFPNLIAKASEINFDLEDSDGDGQPTILYNGNKILYCFCKKIVAGVHDLPKLDLSSIAEEVGWIDVEKLAYKQFPDWELISKHDWHGIKNGFIDGFKAAQSLNEKKFSEEDIIDFYEWCDISDEAARFWRLKRVYPSMDGSHNSLLRQRRIELFQIWVTKRKPKEYNVEVEMERTRYPKGEDGWEDIYVPKITNNTIKITKIVLAK